ncbi:MAG: 1-acyl-sn-glycerol-3-phosphate acyltransferase [Acidimicrobiia bacterium]|nr:1-acyl-sn-glycerol-3-phosphate acyltransferase [Acidimicrobiia bacterium]
MSDQQLEEKVLRIWQTRRARWLYAVLRVAILLVGRIYLRTQVQGAEKLRLGGAFIVAPVHRSNLDAPLVNACCPRIVRSLAKREMFPGGVGTWFSAMCGSFPIRRGVMDRRSLEAAMELLHGGEPLLIFPEGTRQTGKHVGKIFGGAGYLALRAKVPIIPVGIAGTEQAMPAKAKLLRPGPVSIVVGEPLVPPEPVSERLSSELRADFTAVLRCAMQDVMERAYVQASTRRGWRDL